MMHHSRNRGQLVAGTIHRALCLQVVGWGNGLGASAVGCAAASMWSAGPGVQTNSSSGAMGWECMSREG
jgi:hypothetical protein